MSEFLDEKLIYTFFGIFSFSCHPRCAGHPPSLPLSLSLSLYLSICPLSLSLSQCLTLILSHHTSFLSLFSLSISLISFLIQRWVAIRAEGTVSVRSVLCDAPHCLVEMSRVHYIPLDLSLESGDDVEERE